MLYGEVAEWLKAHAWKACLQEIVTGVRIPSSPHVFRVNECTTFNIYNKLILSQ